MDLVFDRRRLAEGVVHTPCASFRVPIAIDLYDNNIEHKIESNIILYDSIHLYLYFSHKNG